MHLDGATPVATRSREDCPFCHLTTLDTILTQTEHFFLLADFAPLIEGHLLIVPREHYPCYGAVPASLDGELLALKARVTDFLTEHYAPPIFFEHGAFHQTVFHAHLHAFPFGPVDLPLQQLAAPGGRASTGQDALREWYTERGPYFYFELPAVEAAPALPEAAIFPADETYYRRALGALRAATATTGDWQPPMLRQRLGRPKVAAVAAKWQAATGEVPIRTGMN